MYLLCYLDQAQSLLCVYKNWEPEALSLLVVSGSILPGASGHIIPVASGCVPSVASKSGQLQPQPILLSIGYNILDSFENCQRY